MFPIRSTSEQKLASEEIGQIAGTIVTRMRTFCHGYSREGTLDVKRFKTLLLIFYTTLCGVHAEAQSASQPDALFTTVKSLDAKLFEAYNRCDLTTLGAMVSDDLEFYHDLTGLSVGKAPFLAAIKQNVCGKVERELLPQTLEVYPLKGFGAVEIGIHRFHHPAHPEDGMGDAKFVTLWQNDHGVWRMTRTISYEHNHGLLAK